MPGERERRGQMQPPNARKEEKSMEPLPLNREEGTSWGKSLFVRSSAPSFRTGKPSPVKACFKPHWLRSTPVYCCQGFSERQTSLSHFLSNPTFSTFKPACIEIQWKKEWRESFLQQKPMELQQEAMGENGLTIAHRSDRVVHWRFTSYHNTHTPWHHHS